MTTLRGSSPIISFRNLLLAAATVPVAVLLHEAGHVAGYVAYGLPDPSLHYASSGFAGQAEMWELLRRGDREGAEAIGSVRGAGLATVLAILISYVSALAGLWALHRRLWGVVPAAFALAAATRFPLIALAYAIGSPGGTDEAHVRLALGFPDLPLMILGIAFMLATLAAVVRLAPEDSRGRFVAETAAGVLLGLGAYMGLLGPLLLP